jgi:hypothetical protein
MSYHCLSRTELSGHIHPDVQDLGILPLGLEQAHGKVGAACGKNLHAQDLETLACSHFADDLPGTAGVGHVLDHDKYLFQPMDLPQLDKVCDDLFDQLPGLAVNAKAVLVLVVFLSHHGVVPGRKHSRREDGNLLVFGQKGHCSQCGLRTHRPTHNEVGILLENQFLHGQKRLAHGHARLEIPRVDNLDLEGTFGTAHFDPALGIDFLHGKHHASLRSPPVQKGGGERGADDNGFLSESKGRNNGKDQQQKDENTKHSFHNDPPFCLRFFALFNALRAILQKGCNG